MARVIAHPAMRAAPRARPGSRLHRALFAVLALVDLRTAAGRCPGDCFTTAAGLRARIPRAGALCAPPPPRSGRPIMAPSRSYCPPRGGGLFTRNPAGGRRLIAAHYVNAAAEWRNLGPRSRFIIRVVINFAPLGDLAGEEFDYFEMMAVYLLPLRPGRCCRFLGLRRASVMQGGGEGGGAAVGWWIF